LKYRRIVEEAVSDCFGRPSFFGEVVEMVMGRVKARVEQKNPQEMANGKSTPCAFAPQVNRGDKVNGQTMRFAPQGDRIRELAEREAQKLKREIEQGFVEKGILTLPGHSAG
jgi:hypothetical protein